MSAILIVYRNHKQLCNCYKESNSCFLTLQLEMFNISTVINVLAYFEIMFTVLIKTNTQNFCATVTIS